MLVVTAATFDRAVELTQEYFDKRNERAHSLYRSIEEIPTMTARAYTSEKGFYEVPLTDPKAETFNDDTGWDKWVLSKEYDLVGDVPEQVLLNYNYA